MSAYTDEDVQAGVRVLVSAPLENSEEQDVQAILEVVAPAIAARALRDLADWIGGGSVSFVVDAGQIRMLADEIERP